MNWKYDQDPVVKVDRRIRWHYTTTILRLRIGARLTRYRNCKFRNGCPAISRHADGISRYSVPPSAGPLLPLSGPTTEHSVKQLPDIIQTFNLLSKYKYQNLYDLCSLNGLTFFWLQLLKTCLSCTWYGLGHPEHDSDSPIYYMMSLKFF